MGTKKIFAICIQCGHIKKFPFDGCIVCHFSPLGNADAMAKSFYLSTQHVTEFGSPMFTVADLTKFSSQIEHGESYHYDESILSPIREFATGHNSPVFSFVALDLIMGVLMISMWIFCLVILSFPSPANFVFVLLSLIGVLAILLMGAIQFITDLRRNWWHKKS